MYAAQQNMKCMAIDNASKPTIKTVIDQLSSYKWHVFSMKLSSFLTMELFSFSHTCDMRFPEPIVTAPLIQAMSSYLSQSSLALTYPLISEFIIFIIKIPTPRVRVGGLRITHHGTFSFLETHQLVKTSDFVRFGRLMSMPSRFYLFLTGAGKVRLGLRNASTG